MPGETVQLAALAGSDLAARGYHAQVHAQDDSLALFHLDRRRRRAIRQQDGSFVVGDAAVRRRRRWSSRRRERPAGFSPNVLLRPIVQDTLFPTICYVAGPNELAYLGQLRGVYEQFGVPMPLMYPRASATLLDSAALRFLTKYKLPLEALQAQDEAALNELLEDADSAGGRRVVRRRGARHRGADGALDRRRCRRSIRRSKARRDRRSSGCSTICRRCTAR